jgi:hypothetical protein
MPQFSIGDKVVRVDSGAHGTVINIRQGRGRTLYQVVFPTGEETVLEVALALDFNISDPFERCKNGIFGSYADYSKRNTTFKIKNSNNSTISSLKASKTLFRAYQFKPLLKFLNSPNRRLLVADEVGLGKTIEAGHIMLELKARRELKSVLIVCPKSLQEKWKAELYEKFGLAFKIVESSKDLIADLNAKAGNVRAIINYEKIRLRKTRDEEEIKDGKYSNLIDYLQENQQRFSLVLCDEAHKMRNRENQTYRGAQVLMRCADAALFLTATPIMISEENLYNLLHLLDNTRYFNYDIFRNRLNENRPFVEAISKLNNNHPLQDIALELVNAVVTGSYTANDEQMSTYESSIQKIFENDPLFKEIIQLLLGEDSHQVRARLQYLLGTMSVMNTVFSRTRKRDVTTDMSQAERKPHFCRIDLTDEEQADYDAVIEDYTNDNSYTDYWGEEQITQGGALGLVQKKRLAASSVWAYLNDESDLDRGYDDYSSCVDSKVDKLIEVAEEVFRSGGVKKIVVFAVFRKTLKYLNIRLKKAGYNSLVIHGQVSNRADILQQFKTDPNIHFLLSSEVGSEGLDMQFCNSLVNYDLPWNPMVVEQRIGRIDRFGQQSPVVNIYNFVVAGSIQETIYERLLERIGIFRGTIGDMEAILDAQVTINGKTKTIQDVYNEMERELFTKQLSKEEMNRKIEEVERAIENEKLNLQNLQEGLSNTLTNDAYFRDEINRILHNNAYVTKEELENFLRVVMNKHLTTCELEEVAPEIFEFKVSMSQPSALKNFLTQYGDTSDEGAISLSQFRSRIIDSSNFKLTFSQEVAYDNPNIHYLNIYHPFIHACLNYIVKNEDETHTSFSYALDADDLLQSGSKYYLGLYQISSSRMVQGVEKKTAELLPIVFNLQTNQLETEEEIIDRIFRRSQVEGHERNINAADIVADVIDDMSYDFTEYIANVKQQRYDEETRQAESDRLRNVQQTKEYYSLRIANHEENIREWERELEYGFFDDKYIRGRQGAIRLAKAGIQTLERELEERLSFINENKQLTIDEKLISLNLITIK